MHSDTVWLNILMMLLASVHAQGYLDGIGYREQELQLAKGVNFASESPTGVGFVSFGGGTHIFIKGYGLHDNPQSNQIVMYSHDFKQDIFAPPLTEDDAFNSHPVLGQLAYRLPAPDDLIGVPMNFLDEFQVMDFTLSLMVNGEKVECKWAGNCNIKYKKSHTPVVYYISPRVVYYEAETNLIFDPKWTMTLIRDLQSDELPFINAKLGGSLMDFEGYLDNESGFGAFYRNQVTGKIGEIPIGQNYNITMQWETGQAYVLKQEATFCSYDNLTCYQARSVPVIFEQSSNIGYTTGGMNLTVKGYGFQNGVIDAKVDGQDCHVTTQSEYSFSCEVQPKAAESVNGTDSFGSHGVRVGTKNCGFWELDNPSEPYWYQKLHLNMEGKRYGGDNFGRTYKGWFVPPATKRYRFYASCDDQCKLYFSKTPNQATWKDLVVHHEQSTDWRDYWETARGNAFIISEWFSLTAGEHYYIEGQHVEYGGGDYFSVAVEIEQDDIEGHHMSMKEIQYVSVAPVQNYDTTRINITDLDEGEFVLIFSNPNDMTKTTSKPIHVKMSEDQVTEAVKSYYQTKFSSGVKCNITLYDVNGTNSTYENATEAVIYIQMTKLITGASVSGIQVVKTSSAATIEVALPSEVQLSAEPLSGKFQIKCVDSEGYESLSNPIEYSYRQVNWINDAIHQGCSRMYDLTEVQQAHNYDYNENGISFLIRFLGMNSKPGQFSIVSSEDDPLTGTDLTYYSNATVPYSNNLFYDPIPFEFLQTYEDRPQLIVKVGDSPAVCKNLTCDFSYVVPDEEISGFTFDSSSRKLSMSGANLPSNMDVIDRILFAQSECTVDQSTLSSTNVECTLENEPTCGKYKPQLLSHLGMIPVADAVAAITIDCVVTQATPNTDLNVLGGDYITFSGNYLPRILEKSTVSLKFSDTSSTPCIVQSSTTTSLVCLTSFFGYSANGQQYDLEMIINGLTVSHGIQFNMRTSAMSSVTILPSTLSPVLKSNMTINLGSDFPYTLAKEDFQVNATSTTNSSYTRYLNVIDVDDATKTITCKFGGAYSGKFNMYVRHKTYGIVDTTGVELDVGGYVTTFTPSTGSIYGGTLLTITGQNFGNEITDNPVQISSNGGVGSIDCYVQTTSLNEIKCRVDSQIEAKTGGDVNKLIVFLKTSEEAQCNMDTDCAYTWTGNVPQVTGVSTEFDGSDWIVVVTGTDFTGDTDSVEFFVGGEKQVTKSVSATEARFAITNVTSDTLNDNNLYFDVGTPKNHNIIEEPISLIPKLKLVEPNTGSVKGSLIRLTFAGVGVETSSLQIVNAAGTSICSEVNIVEYGIVNCKTLAQEISNSALQVKLGSTTYQCSNSDTSACEYKQQSADTSFPAITGQTISSSSSLTISGSNLDYGASDSYTVSASFAGVEADSVVVTSATEVSATWSFGIPIVATGQLPVLKFTSSDEKWAHFATSTVALENTITLGAISDGLQCSFAGGCTYSVEAAGLAQVLKTDADNSYITICGEKCQLQESLSDASKAVCKVPKVSTIYSNSNFEISTPHENLKSGNYFGTGEYLKAFDDDLLITPSDSSASCQVGMKFRDGHIGLISQVRYYMGRINDKTKLVGLTKFQGSNDGTTYTDLFEMDENLHEGWNYFEWDRVEDYPKYQYYRFSGSQGGCAINEVSLTGVETINSEDTAYTCQAKLHLGDSASDLNAVQYTGDKTASLDAISPRFGRVEGGTEVTFSGTGFSSDISKYTITIDGINCPVSAATTTSVTCTTGKRPGLVQSSLDIYIDGYGSVSLKGKLFRYVSLWSSDTTWGGEFAPMEDESIYVPAGLNLLVDVDSTPKLMAVIVEGSIIFAPDDDPNHHRTFDARYVFVNGGLFEVGTEEFPYTSKITITMHGTVKDPYLPVYGNKVIGVRYGTLDMHGPKRTPTWTTLETTATAFSTQITLREPVDWQVGEEIAIASTSFDPREGERRTIKAIDSTRKIITLDYRLDYKHFAATERYGDVDIDMRAEVGLLSRNVVFRGDPETSLANQYGANLFLHSSGDDSVIARLSYIEGRQVGQAFKIGRYAIHFHMIGAVHKSYAKGVSINTGFNRAFTLHGTHFLRLEENVAYEVKGHTFFIEDAIEQNNYMYKNLVIKTMRSMSLLNTDQTPACFWITHPNNIFIDNHAAGSDRYGFWYDLQTHSTGPSANEDVCPENSQVGEFRGNHAHSVGRYGLRIFHNMSPRKFPCSPIKYDESNTDDPYWQNPAITANFDDFTGWKCNRNGAIAGQVGDVHFNNFKIADNILAGIEFEKTHDYGDNFAQINGATIVGRTSNTDYLLDQANPHGIITPRSENFVVRNVKFYNYNFNNASCLGSCSHCFHPASTDSGARTVTFEKLYFDSTVDKKIRYQEPHRAIYKDLDGTLTGIGPNSWATFYYKHFDLPECQYSDDIENTFNGAICDNTATLRRVAFHNYAPGGSLRSKSINVMRWDDDWLAQQDDLEAYRLNLNNSGRVDWRTKKDPSDGWAVPFVIGHKYKITWGETGIDWEQIQVTSSERWEEGDKPIYFVHNFTDVRESYKITANGQEVLNNSIHPVESERHFGQNVLYPDKKELHFIVDGYNKTDKYSEISMLIVASRCDGVCEQAPIIEVEEDEAEFRYWSDVKNWPDEQLPKEGDTVEIQPGWKMILDLEETPVFARVNVNGLLYFSDEHDVHLQAMQIYVRAGELHIGNETHPFQHNALITLHGGRESDTMVFDSSIEAGNKLIANVGIVKMYGKARDNKMYRLTQEAFKGDHDIYVQPGAEIYPGDRIALAATSYKFEANEDSLVTAYDSATGKITLEHEVHYHHWGAEKSTADLYEGIDIRGEVMVLSRNIKIQVPEGDGWGCQVLTSDTAEFDLLTGEIKFRTGQLIMHNVELFNCSQAETMHSAIRFENAVSLPSDITNCTVHNGNSLGISIQNSQNIKLYNNVVYNMLEIGITIDNAKKILIDNNIVSWMRQLGDHVNLRGMYCICSVKGSKTCTDNQVTNNIAAGGSYAGFIAPGHDCGDYSTVKFKDNVAHSIAGYRGGHGALIYPDPTVPGHVQCYEGSFFTGYKNYYQGAYAYYSVKQVIFSNMKMIDNRHGFGAALQQSGQAQYDDDILISLNNNKIYGETPIPDCPKDGSFCKKSQKFGMIMSGGTLKNKDLHILSQSSMPVHKVKSEGVWGQRQEIRGNQFINFTAKTQDNMRQVIFEVNEYQSDYVPLMEFYDNEFINIEDGAFAYIYDPPQKWASIDNCGLYPCSAPKNTLMDFEGSIFTGKKPYWATPNFQVIADNDGFAPYIDTCKNETDMNVWICKTEKMGVLMLESEDPDSFDRSMQPIYVKKEGTEMANNLNSMMDHLWDGFYTSQRRMSRFPSVFQGERGTVYDLNFTGTPAKNMRFQIFSKSKSTGATIRIAYPGAESRQILVDGKSVEYNQWDESISMYGPIKQKFCGENRYIGVQNILEFYLTAGCKLQIKPRNAIQTKIRMEWTMEEFFADGGTTTFIDRLTASLGIHASTVKIVSVYEGSLIINYEISVDGDDEEALEQIKETQNSMFESGAINLGAPIMAVETTVSMAASEAAASGSTYTPVQIVSDPFDSSVNVNYPTEFNPDISLVANEEMVYYNKTVTVELEPETVVKTKTIIVEQDAEPETIVQTIEYTEKPKSVVVPIVIAVLGAGIFAVTAFFVYRKLRYGQVEEVTKIHQQLEVSTTKKNLNVDDPSYVDVHVNSRPSNPNNDQSVEYRQQYDPNNDFAIFLTGNVALGGLQTIQEKMNIADKVNDDSSSDEDEKIPKSREFSVDSPGQTGSNDSGKFTPTKESSEKLPEDKEIHSLEDE